NLIPNPTSSPIEPKLEIWSVSVAGGAPVRLAEGDKPKASPSDDRVVFEKGRELWVVPADGSKPPARLFYARGKSESAEWSPDGSRLAFVSARGDYSFIAIYAGDSVPLTYLAPGTSLDGSPRWSPDASRLAFVRQPGRGGAETPPLQLRPRPWSIWVADVATATGKEVWKSPETLRGSTPGTLGGPNLNWGADGRLLFVTELDGWPHLYSMAASGGAPSLLTPGNFMVEFVAVAPDRRSVIYNANTGSDPDDGERRHLYRVPIDRATPTAITSGSGIEWAPAVTGDGSTLAYIASDAGTPGLPRVQPLAGGPARTLNQGALPSDFPASRLVVPQHVTFKAPDGATIHGQLFKAAGGESRRPAIVFVHGGPPRQMLLGWHYMFYYTNSYAMNQYLASLGYVVLSVNYRLGIGYGREFQNPPRGGARGTQEYLDVLAGGKYLQSRPDVDPARIGIWGGSYGGFLGAMALARNSDVFAAGVDFHGVHDRVSLPSENLEIAARVGDGIGEHDLEESVEAAWTSSPSKWAARWRSPVLLIHGDDDRNVRVEQTVDLVQRLRKYGVSFEEMIIPDDIHDFLLHRNWVRADSATAAFFEKTLKAKRAATR
ncbi:MAG: S9 family peptidase, partial [Gemmatimonadetes bacterium]|nr:S9 family peptidase [Gemmatimonadota bacterium]